MRRARPLAAALGAVALALVTAPARAQPAPEERAAILVDEANRHYNLAEYAPAIAAYKEAYKLVPEPLLLWNLAQAYRLSGDCASALTFYRTYVREAPTGELRARADQWIAELATCARKPGAADATTTTTAAPGPGTDVAPPPPPPPDTAPAPGPVASAPPPTTTATTGSPTLRLAGLGAIGAGAVGVLAGGYFSWKASGHARDVEDLCAVTCAGADVVALEREGDAAERKATILYVAGGVALAAGIGVTIWAGQRRERRPAVALVPTRGGAAASAAWSF